MIEHIQFNDNAGRIAYEAWVSEFHDRIEDADPWGALTESTQDAWDTVAETVIENRIGLPVGGVELFIRRPGGQIGFIWVGEADEQMRATVREAVERAMK